MLGAKARVLELLAGGKHTEFVVDPFVRFTVNEWRESAAEVLAKISEQPAVGPVVAVRSSAWDEDGTHVSAGVFRTRLGVHVASRADLRSAIEDVIASYAARPEVARRPNYDEVIVQRQVTSVRLSGVLSTRDPISGGPYVTVEFDDVTGLTDTVTSGHDCRRIAFLRGDARNGTLNGHSWDRLISAAHKIEAVLNAHDVVVEFAIDRDDRVHVLQAWVRNRMLPELSTDDAIKETVKRATRRLRSRKPIVLSDMSDWNPAEMLGSNPTPLDVSLYERLVTNSVWANARAGMGYFDLRPRRLMTVIAGKPYIDVEASFLSLTPAGLTAGTRRNLVRDRLEYLVSRPELHDKVELEVLPTCAGLGTDPRIAGLTSLSRVERTTLQKLLAHLTSRFIELGANMIEASRADAEHLAASRARWLMVNQSPDSQLLATKLRACVRYGSLPFARVARLAFVARDLLASLAREGAISFEWLDEYWTSLATVATSVSTALADTSHDGGASADFLQTFGFLRPRTYDITSKRYDQALPVPSTGGRREATNRIELTARQRSAIRRTLTAGGLPGDPEHFLSFARAAIVARESAKLAFTKVLSDILEDVAALGHRHEFSREDMAFLQISEIAGPQVDVQGWTDTIEMRRQAYALNRHIVLPPVISSPLDVLVVKALEAQPNFITGGVVAAPVALVDKETERSCTAIAGKIVAIEAADPGYDWIFSCRIAGLITRYGGAASHMAIRCGEFGIPAAIGCGEQVFADVLAARQAEIDCVHKLVRCSP